MKNNTSLVYNVCLMIGDALAITVAFTIAYILRVTLNHQPLSASVGATFVYKYPGQPTTVLDSDLWPSGSLQLTSLRKTL